MGFHDGFATGKLIMHSHDELYCKLKGYDRVYWDYFFDERTTIRSYFDMTEDSYNRVMVPDEDSYYVLKDGTVIPLHSDKVFPIGLVWSIFADGE